MNTMFPPIPPDEIARLAALVGCNILDTDPDPGLDELVRLTAAMFAAPIALITLVDRQRQWFKSRIGLSLHETPRDIAFCAYTVLGNQLMVVPDAHLDERFASNPLVTSDPHIRFYAGAPLLVGGHAIGSLCIIDFKPRTIDAQERDALTVLCRQVVAHIELRVARQREAQLLQERELERARIALGDQERLLADIVDSLVDGVVTVGADARLLLINGAARRILGDVVPECLTDWPRRLGLRRADGSEVVADELPLMRALRGEDVDAMELHRGDANHPSILIASARPLRRGASGSAGAVMTLRDASAEREVQRARNQDQQRLRTVLDQLPAAVWTVDHDLRLTSSLGGQPAGIGLEGAPSPGEEVATPAAPAIVAHRSALRGVSRAYEIERDGRSYHCHVDPLRDAADGAIVGALGVSLDVTDQRRLQAQYQQAQKMESIGRLAGGMAHDFNNILTIVIGYAELILQSLPDNHVLRPRVDAIRQAANRAAALIHQLMAYSRKQTLDLRPLSLNCLVSALAPMLQRLLGEDVQMALDLHEPLPAVCGDPAQLESVLMNLAVNARDAMPRGGRLRIATRMTGAPGAGALPERFGGTATTWVELRVEDNGAGMDAATAARAFEPFFTTKEVGKGTGLGLAMVFGVIAQCGGAVAIDSAPGKGTAILAWLPTATGPVIDRDKRAPRPAQAAAGPARVLVVEDDAAVRDLAIEVLAQHGLSVTAARDGAEALRLVETLGQTVDLLITDIVMPGMSGFDLAHALTRRWPGLRVIFTSGFSEDEIARYGGRPQGTFMNKPYAPNSLVDEVWRALEA